MDPDTAVADETPTRAESPAGRGPAAPSRRHAAWLERLAAHPHAQDFYRVLRRFEAAYPQLPPLGEALRPADEPLRVGQPAELSFAATAIHALQLRADGPPVLQQRIFGLLGSNGPLPLHLTELARERAHHHGDPTLQRFLDLLTHRFALLFYRAWAQAQPALALDRPGQARFERRLGALAGIGLPRLLERDALGDATKLHFTGRLAMQVRNAEGLLALCKAQFDVPVAVEQWRGHWMPLARDERSRLGPRSAQGSGGLGGGAVLGGTVWDVQHRFRIVVGPLSLARYADFLPGGRDLDRLQAIVRQWVGLEFAWDLTLVLARAEVPPMHLGRPGAAGRLGRTGWLGRYARDDDARDMTIDVESTLRSRRRPRRPDPPSRTQEERP
jgi:type VI secretion system protein ImpH